MMDNLLYGNSGNQLMMNNPELQKLLLMQMLSGQQSPNMMKAPGGMSATQYPALGLQPAGQSTMNPMLMMMLAASRQPNTNTNTNNPLSALLSAIANKNQLMNNPAV